MTARPGRRPPGLARPVLALALSLAAAAEARADGLLGSLGRPVDLSLDGHRGDALFDFCTIAVTVLFVIMCAVMAWSLLLHRQRRGRERAAYLPGSSRRHLLGTLGLALLVFLGVDGTMLLHSSTDLREGFWKFPAAADQPVRLEVLAQQWAWNVRHPGPDDAFDTADDIVTLNEIHVPAGRPVILKLQSKDVIHSLYLPNFRIKQDAIPGTITRMWFAAPERKLAGKAQEVVELGCAQHCGTSHYKMKGTLTIHSPASYEAWLRDAASDAVRRFDPDDTEARWGWDWEAEGRPRKTAAAAPATTPATTPAQIPAQAPTKS